MGNVEYSAVPKNVCTNISGRVSDLSSAEILDEYSEAVGTGTSRTVEDIHVAPVGLEVMTTILSNFAGNFHSERKKDRFCASTFSDFTRFRMERHFSTSIQTIHQTFQYIQDSGKDSSLIGIRPAQEKEEPGKNPFGEKSDSIFSSREKGSIFVTGDEKSEFDKEEAKVEDDEPPKPKFQHEYKPNSNVYDSLCNFRIYFGKNSERPEPTDSIGGKFRKKKKEGKKKREIRKVIIALVKKTTIYETSTSKARSEEEIVRLISSFTKKSPRNYYFVVSVGMKSVSEKNKNERKFERVCLQSGIKHLSITEFGDLHTRLSEILDIIVNSEKSSLEDQNETNEDEDGESSSGLSSFSEEEEEEEKREEEEKTSVFSEIEKSVRKEEEELEIAEMVSSPVDGSGFSRNFSVDWGVLLDLT